MSSPKARTKRAKDNKPRVASGSAASSKSKSSSASPAKSGAEKGRERPEIGDLVERLAATLERYRLTEIELELDAEGERIRVRRDPPVERGQGIAQGPHGPLYSHVPARSVEAPFTAVVRDPLEEAPASAAPRAPALAPATPRAPEPATAASGGASVYITSPFVGTFYTSPSPQAAAFVERGQSVKKGQVLCIVEAMKLMNEIESDVAGTVVDVIAVNGQPVEFGEPLFQIRP
jgi:acetyl-CoA carboxylase biotin carboxyl carrier protein